MESVGRGGLPSRTEPRCTWKPGVHVIPLSERSSLIHFKYCCWRLRWSLSPSGPRWLWRHKIFEPPTDSCHNLERILVVAGYVCCPFNIESPFHEHLTGSSNSWVFTVCWPLPLMSHLPSSTILGFSKIEKQFGHLVVIFIPSQSPHVEKVHSLKWEGESDKLKEIFAWLPVLSRSLLTLRNWVWNRQSVDHSEGHRLLLY